MVLSPVSESDGSGRPMRSVGLERGDLVVGEAEQSVRISWLCWPSVGAGVRIQRSTPAKRNGSDGCGVHADRPGGRGPRSSRGRRTAGAADVSAGVDRRRRRARPRATSRSTASSRSVSAAHAPSFSSSRSCAARRPAWVRSAGSVAQSGRPSASTSADHCSSVATESDQPPLRRRRSRRRPAARPTGCGCPRATSALPYAVHSTISSAEMLSAASNIGRLDQRADAGAVAHARARPARRPPRACRRSGRTARAGCAAGRRRDR